MKRSLVLCAMLAGALDVCQPGLASESPAAAAMAGGASTDNVQGRRRHPGATEQSAGPDHPREASRPISPSAARSSSRVTDRRATTPSVGASPGVISLNRARQLRTGLSPALRAQGSARPRLAMVLGGSYAPGHNLARVTVGAIGGPATLRSSVIGGPEPLQRADRGAINGSTARHR
jgi:hypothetical protein